MMAILLNNMLLEDDAARQRTPLDSKNFAKLRRTATASKCNDLVSYLLFEVVALGCYIRPHMSEYAHTSQDKVNYQTYSSITTSIKAFIANNFIF